MEHFIAALYALIGKMSADEIKAWLPWITEKVTRAAITKLAASERERYSEEWASYLNELPGELTKIWAACGFFWAANVRPHFTHTSPVAESRNGKIASSVLIPRDANPFLNLGDKVQIRKGPLMGITGILVRRKEGLRVVLSIELIQRSISVEIDEQDLEIV